MRRRTYGLILLVILVYLIRDWLDQQYPASTPAPAARKQPVPVKAKDDLTSLDGIGPAYERALNGVGIYTFLDLAAQDAETLAHRLSSVRVTAARIRRDRWIEQASEHAGSQEMAGRKWSANDGHKT
ncbi:MAG: helix-hairpin-helix domain-containing protein [Anaerolineae bacterium]